MFIATQLNWTQLNSTDPVEQRTAKTVVFLFMTSWPTNWVNCCSRCRVEFSWVELCRYKRAFTRLDDQLFTDTYAMCNDKIHIHTIRNISVNFELFKSFRFGVKTKKHVWNRRTDRQTDELQHVWGVIWEYPNSVAWLSQMKQMSLRI